MNNIHRFVHWVHGLPYPFCALSDPLSRFHDWINWKIKNRGAK